MDLPALFPGLSAFAKTATRLHPRRGEPDRSDSHVGGLLLWPAEEPWPTCEELHVVATETPVPPVPPLSTPSPELMAGLATMVPGFAGYTTTDAGSFLRGSTVQVQPGPLVPVAQLRAGDIPDVRCPPGTDMLQVLWCPNTHGEHSGPAIEVRWRQERSVVNVLPAAPPVTASEEHYLPRRCVVHPEQVVEFPDDEELPDDLGERVRAFEDSRQYGEESYSSVSRAPGWKVGGYPSWGVTGLIPMLCDGCHSPMDLLLTISSSEHRGAAWFPVEDAHVPESWGDPAWTVLTKPTGVTAGNEDGLRIFVCTACPEWPIRVR
ncbi:hypothetical protein [Actinoplanes palleronii]|uniref:hypothetical protein n=1 Tax=Actinoplanes palleronii TaxID=113570 RepID=UPI00194211D5|nr:hypothetical protein [Actinoplanes palleronii]